MTVDQALKHKWFTEVFSTIKSTLKKLKYNLLLF